LKKHEDNVLFDKFCKSFDIIALYETWQRNADEFNQFLSGYTCYSNMRFCGNKRGSGGVTVFVRDTFSQHFKRIYDKFDDCVILNVSKEFLCLTQDVILYFTYIAPERSPIYEDVTTNGIENLQDKLLAIVSDFPSAHLVVAGDLNARISDKLDYIPNDDVNFIFGETAYTSDTFCAPRSNKDVTLNRFGVALCELCSVFDIHALNGRSDDDKLGEFTCTANGGKSIVDYILIPTSLFEHVSHFEVGSEDFSDHFPLKLHVKLNIKNTHPVDYSNLKTAHHFKWNEGCRETFIELFETYYTAFERLPPHGNAFEKLNAFMNVFEQAGACMKKKRFGPQNRSKNVTQPEWWDAECSNLKYEKYRALRKFRTTNTSGDFEQYKFNRNKFKRTCNTKQSELQRSKREQLCNNSNNPTKFWDLLKKANMSRNDSSDLISGDDWYDYFRKLFDNAEMDDGDQIDELPELTRVINADYLNLDITDEETRKSLKYLKSNTAAGYDGLCIEMFKVTAERIVHF